MWTRKGLITAAALAAALLGSAGSAMAIPYSNGLVITNGSTQFTFGTCSVVFVGDVTPQTCSAVQLVPVKKVIAGITQFGFAINTLISAVGSSSNITLTLEYTAVDLAASSDFSGGTLTQTSTGTTLASVTDTIDSTGNVVQTKLDTTGIAPTDTDPLTGLPVIKGEIVAKVTGSGANGRTQISIVQTFNSTAKKAPEPGSLALVGAALLAGSRLLGRRKRSGA